MAHLRTASAGMCRDDMLADNTPRTLITVKIAVRKCVKAVGK
jgi:hypothetical protein